MKKVFIIYLVLFSTVCFSQTYLELPDSNAKWINIHKTFTGNPWNVPIWQVQYCAFGEDTVLNAMNYFKIDTCNGGYKGAIRNDNGKVFFFPKDSTQEFLLYDFTLNEGDTAKDVYIEVLAEIPELHDVYVAQGGVDSVMIDGVYRKRIMIQSGNEFGLPTWIEGIGNSQGLFWEPWANLSAYALELYCMSANNLTIYPDAGFGACESTIGIHDEYDKELEIQIFPNPTNSDINIKTDLSILDLYIIDSKGVRIFASENLSNNPAIKFDTFQKDIYLIVIHTKNQTYTRKIIKN